MVGFEEVKRQPMKTTGRAGGGWRYYSLSSMISVVFFKKKTKNKMKYNIIFSGKDNMIKQVDDCN
jgi:hypothetical protein